jgi:hypothetical protein
MPEAFVVTSPNGLALRALNYTPEVERLKSARRSGTTKLGALISAMGPAYGSVFVRVDCEPEHGIELMSQADMFLAEPSGRRIRLDSMARPERHLVNRWQVLIAGAGTLGESELYGRAILADTRLAGKYVGPDALVLTFNTPGDDQALFTYAFLLTRVGTKAIRATSYGTKVLRLRRDLLRELPVPVPTPEITAQVGTLVRQASDLRGTYLRNLLAARQTIENLPEMREANSICGQRARRSTCWDGALPTLCAWNYASTGDALRYLGHKWSRRLKDVLEPNGAFNGPRFARIDCQPPHGIDFLSQRDVFLMRPIARRIVRPDVPDRLLFVPRNAVLAGSHGQLTDGGLFGKVELASFAAYKGGVTQDLLRLLFVPTEQAIAYVFLSTLVGQRLLKSTAVGTSIPSMRLDLLGEIPYPHLSQEKRSTIEQHLRAAEQARLSGDQSENEAVRIIEQEVLPKWLG